MPSLQLYQEGDPAIHASTEEEKRALFVQLCCRVTKRDLRPFFNQTWGMPLPAVILDRPVEGASFDGVDFWCEEKGEEEGPPPICCGNS